MSKTKTCSRHYRALRKNVLEKTEKEKKLDDLFEKIRAIEQENKKAKAEEAPVSKTDGVLDKNIEEAAKAPSEKKRSYVVKKLPEKRTRLAQYKFSEEQELPEFYILNDDRTKDIVNYEEFLNNFISMIESVQDQFSYCSSRLSEADKEIQDFLHELRQPKKNAYEGFKLYQLGHHLEIKRQAYKNSINILRPLTRLYNEESLTQMKNAAELLRTAIKECSNRIYMQKSNLKLPVGDAFRALSKDEQSLIKENYEKSRQALKQKRG